MNTSLSRAPSRRGFTLVELLTVIAILGILAAILIPTIGRVRASAKSAACKSNVRQLGATFLLYASDNRGKFPCYTQDLAGPPLRQNVVWYVYLNELGYLPRKNGNSLDSGITRCEAVDPFRKDVASYGTVRGLIENPVTNNVYGSLGSVRITDVTEPSRLWLVGDCMQAGGDVETGVWYSFWAPGSGGFGSNHRPAMRHPGDLANAAMFDGSVRQFTLAQLTDRNGATYPFYR